MKLSDIVQPIGLYVGLRVLDPTNVALYAHCQAHGIPVKKSEFERRLHTTLIYSRVAAKIKPDPEITKHHASFVAYDIFTGRNNENVLVLRLNAPSVVARHLALMSKHKLTYDFPEFLPHITLSYNYPSTDVAGIPPFNLPIILGEEYTEDLDFSWSP